MRIALSDPHLDHLWVIHPGHHRYPVDERLTGWPLKQIPDLAAGLPS